ncbi:MAG: mechanosensitive ion channel domain-containing protein [Novosphingobium sp.]
MRAIRLAVALLVSALAAPLGAALPSLSPDPAPTASAPATAAIADTQDAGADARIAQRITDIFAELPAFQDVSADVNAGVVTLAGKVPAEADIARAEAIAGRIAGVVTVENRLQRDVSVSGTQAVDTLADRIDGFVKLLPLAGVALAIWAVIAGIGYLVAGVGNVWHRLAPNSFLADLIASAIRFVAVLAGLVIALDILGATALLGAVLGGAGLVGIALGFAMRDTIENYVASLMLSLRQPFRANDWVLIDNHEGRVIRLTSRATVLMTLDGNHLRIPNSTVFKAVILNYTRNPQRRFEFTLGIDADDDPNAARLLGQETLGSLDFVLDDPPPEARIVEVGDSNIVICFLGWIDQQEADWHKARSRAIAAVKAALEHGGFALPEPIYRLRFDARTTPLPLENVEAGPPRTAPKRKAAPAPAAEEDVAPGDKIAEMVSRERALPAGGQEKDLLDPKRPVE